MSKRGGQLTTVSRDTIAADERAAVALQIAAKAQEAEADITPEALAVYVVDDDASYATITELRAEVRAEIDQAVKLRQGAAQPWKKVATTIEEMFRPWVRNREKLEAHLRGLLESYQVAKVKAEREARALAASAANAGDDATMLAALNTSTELSKRTPEGGRVSLKWQVKRIVADMLPAEYWTPDVAKIEAVAKAHKGEEPPVIPGVVFEQVASVAVKR